MDESLILNGTLEEVISDLTAINIVAARWHKANGYTVIDGGLVPRNEETGEDDLEAPRTTTYAEPVEAPDGSWYILSPTNDPRFNLWRNYLKDYIVKCQEITLPREWIPVGD